MDQNNKYTTMQKNHYNATADIMAIENHRSHDLNPDYYGLLLQAVKNDPKSGPINAHSTLDVVLVEM